MAPTDEIQIDNRLAKRLRDLRTERSWSLDALAQRSGVSRATLSRMENAEVSPTAQVLNKLCVAFGMTLSRLMLMVEDEFAPLVRREAQPVWTDPENGFRRRSVSPPARALSGEALECRLEPGTRIAYDRSPRPGLEHHLILLDGKLTIEVDGRKHELNPGDCLRYQLFGPGVFITDDGQGAHYFLFLV